MNPILPKVPASSCLVERFVLPSARSRLLLLFSDFLNIPIAVWLSYCLRLSEPFSQQFYESGITLIAIAVPVALLVYLYPGHYVELTRYLGSFSVYKLAARNGIIVLLINLLGVVFRLPPPPRSSWFLIWLLLTLLGAVVRFLVRDFILRDETSRNSSLRRVAIYGAGAAGAQLHASLRLSTAHRVVMFIDDNRSLWGRKLGGVPIESPASLRDHTIDISLVLLALPSVSGERRRQILQMFADLDVSIMQVPSIQELTDGSASINALRPIPVEELLERDSVSPDPALLSAALDGQIVCVTGAGGSIGSELCRQIIQFSPKRLILLESSEHALHSIQQELESCGSSHVELIYCLGNILETEYVTDLFREHSVAVVFHAAAYKHVPLVELNILSGIKNNVLGTFSLCVAARDASVRSFTLISTDKAVRPTNVMGASKRLSELVVKAFADQSAFRNHGQGLPTSTPASLPTYSMVRFGNVLGSSGSVIPIFHQQIASGGPITLTHNDIVRYFMTIPEAAQLVIQSAAIAFAGDIFLLDMGKPVAIRGLAEKMIRLSGLTLRDSANPDGDIEILCTGLRPGEKLYEELLVDGKSTPTSHPLIFKAAEDRSDVSRFTTMFDQFLSCLERRDLRATLLSLQMLVPEWVPSSSAKV